MRFCEDHWKRLREAIEARGLGDLIASSGATVAQQVAQELEQGEASPTTYEPLMAAHMAILSNAIQTLGAVQPASVQYLMQDGETVPEDLVDRERYPTAAEGATWPRCPLCYLGLAHELTCSDDRCQLPKVDGYAWMIERAADDQKEAWEKIKAERDEGA